MSPPIRSAACMAAARAAADFSDHHCMSPVATSPIRPSARSSASVGSAQPAVMFHRNVLRMPETPLGLNTSSGPRRLRCPAVSEYPGLADPGQRQDDRLILGPGQGLEAVVGPAEPDRVLRRAGGDAVAQLHPGPGPAAVVGRGEPGEAEASE